VAGQSAKAEVFDAPLAQRLDAVERRREEMRDRLRIRAPDDICLVGSKLLFDEVERKVQEIGRRFDPALHHDASAIVRRQVERLSAVIVDFDPREPIRAWTRDPTDDYIVEMAFRADAAAIVSKDADLVGLCYSRRWKSMS
jgi:predicted nucleic acid-binding protein